MDTLFLVALIRETLFGIGWVCAPVAVPGPFGVTPNDIATPFACLYGSAVLSFSILLWYARNSHAPDFRKGAACTLFTYHPASAVLLVLPQLAGLMNALG